MDPFEKLLAISHDIKSPLLAIRRLTERLLQEDDNLPKDVRRRLQLIHDSAVEASKYVEDLDMSSTLAATDEDVSEPVDTADVAKEVVNGYQSYAECKSQTLSCTVASSEDADFTVLGDPLQLREAMSNLVSNALKFSPSGTTVEVEIRRTDEEICFSVADEGPGLGQTEQERLFEPFFQAEPKPTDGEETTGVGLYIVKRIVEKHDGEVEVESEKEEGATFRLRLPVASSITSPRMKSDVPATERLALSRASVLS